MKKSIAILFITALTLAACQSASQTTEVSKTSVVSPTDTPQPTAVVATESQPQISPEVQAKFDELSAKLGEDENGNPIYFVTNPASETVTVGKQNENGEWELADAVKYKIYKTIEEAEASGEIMDTEYVLRGGPGQAAKLNGEPFPEGVLTGLNIEVVKPNWINPDRDQLNFDSEALLLLENNPDKAPYRLAGVFLYKNILNGTEQPGYGYVWQWTNPDGSTVYITCITSSKPNSHYYLTPFASFNFTKDSEGATPILDKIVDDTMNKLMLQWADTDVVPAELQDRALRLSYRRK